MDLELLAFLVDHADEIVLSVKLVCDAPPQRIDLGDEVAGCVVLTTPETPEPIDVGDEPEGLVVLEAVRCTTGVPDGGGHIRETVGISRFSTRGIDVAQEV